MSDPKFALLGDIGGTNARFALVRPGQVKPEQIQVLPVKDFANLDSAARAYLQGVGVTGVTESCMAFASPVHGDRIKLTNSHWSFDKAAMKATLGLQTFKVINDFTAMALGVPHVGADQLVKVGGGIGDATKPCLVIGPGTGLGVSGLIRARNNWIPLSTEGGHVDFAPTDDFEIEILRKLREQFGRVSVERILSGEGLVNLYRAITELDVVEARLKTPREIVEAALSGEDMTARKTLRHFCEILGRVCGNAALTIGTLGGVYICGGIVPRFIEFFKKSNFRVCFEDKGRMAPYLEGIPTYIVTEPFPGLLGAAEALANDEV